MGESKHTPGPWEWDGNVWQYDEQNEAPWLIQAPYQDVRSKTVLSGRIRCNTEADARLIAAAPELLEVLHECIDAQWVIDSHAVEFDGTVHFGPYYDFSGLDGIDRHEFLAEHSCVVWPSGGKWSAYCTYEGSTWFESFDGADAAKETCMKLLDKVMPTHPAMKARAAIAKANGGE